MGKKLKMPAGGLASESKPVEAPAVAEQAADILEAADEQTDSGDGQPLPFSLSCNHCSAGDGIDSIEQATALGWSSIEEDADGMSWDYLGLCPECLKEQREEELADSPAAEQNTEPEIADDDIPPSPAMAAAADAPAPDSASPLVEPAPPAAEQPTNAITPEQHTAYGNALQKHWERHLQWTHDVEAAKEKHTSSAIVRSQADDARKLAKKHEDDALDELMSLLNNEPKEPTFAEVVAELARKRPAAAASDRPAEQSSAPAPANTSEAWRSVPITKLDLPEKLIERLQEDGLNTMGQLEDRRGEISDHKAKWPKGIGSAKITKIEDAVIAWLTANRDQAVFSELQSGQASEQQGEAKGGESTVDMVSADDAQSYADAINARAVELDNDEPGMLNPRLGAGNWEQGRDHYYAGGTLSTCELPPSPAQDDFIRGWLSAGKEAGEEFVIDEEPPAGEEPELQEVGAANEQSLDNGPAIFNPDDI